MSTRNALHILARGLVGAEGRGKDRNRKKNRGKNDGAIQQQIFARCVSQVPACEAEIRRACGNSATCLELALPCCQPLTTCAFTTFLTCADEALSKF